MDPGREQQTPHHWWCASHCQRVTKRNMRHKAPLGRAPCSLRSSRALPVEILQPEARAPEEARCLAWDPFQHSPLVIHFTPAPEINLCLTAGGESSFSAKSILPGGIRKIGRKAKLKLPERQKEQPSWQLQLGAWTHPSTETLGPQGSSMPVWLTLSPMEHPPLKIPSPPVMASPARSPCAGRSPVGVVAPQCHHYL